MQKENLSAAEALQKLKEGNQRYLTAETNPGDVSPKIRSLPVKTDRALMPL